MSAIAGVIHWDGKPVPSAHIEGMMNIVAHRGPDGIRTEVADHVAFGHGLLALQKFELHCTQPVWLPDRSAAIVADARLYNRDDLQSRLGTVPWFRDPVSDAAMILAVYERWGEDAFHLLDGDFSFVLWDARKRNALLVRDLFCTRPLYYFQSPSMLAFASEPKQILVLPDVPVEPDEIAVGEHLFNRYVSRGRSFFEGVSRMLPGRVVEASRDGVQTRKYWHWNATNEIQYQREDDYAEGLREHLKRAVARRLRTDYPVAGELSGGFDCSAVLLSAAALYEEQAQAQPRLDTVSAVFPGLGCDESDLIAAMNERLPFDSRFYDPLSEENAEEFLEEQWTLDAPLAQFSFADVRCFARELASIGARTALTGHGGDELFDEGDYFRDVVKLGTWAEIRREFPVWRRKRARSPGTLVKRTLALVAPRSIRNDVRSVTPSYRWRPPDWAASEFADRFAALPEITCSPIGFPSETQERRPWAWDDPRFHWTKDFVDARAARHGARSCHPLLDRPLSEYVLAIPFRHRIPHEGKTKHLLRIGLGARMPKQLLGRSRKVSYNSYIAFQAEQRRVLLEGEVNHAGSWTARRFIDPKGVKELWRSIIGPNRPSDIGFRDFHAIVNLEYWLRRLRDYRREKVA